ncbi:MAG: PilX N-terminal domain-containing pilus assembly protein [Thiobacillaceae bacterium]|jgi:type IV pilus assembly protein PilX|nr:PilX N-terminal domain-containing pilus assembly protein [Thiobacillaceae bacterium]
MNTSALTPELKPARQQGIALIMGLMFLVVLTLLGMAAMRGTILEERMAGNARDRDLAFQSAEAALRAAELEITGATLQPFAAGTARTPRIADGTLNDYWQTTHDWPNQSVAVGWQPEGTNEVPRYVIEELGVTAGGGTGGLGVGALNDEGVYRVTARGVGSSANTVVILQAVYER